MSVRARMLGRMALTFSGVVFDTADPARVADFWQAALGWTGREPGPRGEAVIFPREGETVYGPPSVVFQPVPEGRSAKNRVHLDLSSDDQAADVERLEGLGARRIDVGQPADATFVVLADVEGTAVDLDARVAEIELAMRREHKSTFRDLLGGRAGLLPVVWVGIGLSVFQQLVGINVIFYYSASLWQSVGIDPSSSFFYSFTTSIINIIGTVIAMVLVDRIGRRPLALIGSVGMAVSLGVAAWAFSYKTGTGGAIHIPGTEGTVALVAAHAFVLFFALSWGVVVWVLLGEMFPNRIRAAALGVAASAQWIANWLITVSFPSLSDWNLSGAYVIYTAFAVLSIPFILKWVPETKGKALEEMG